MGSRLDSPGRIIVVCSTCNDGIVVLDYYEIGSAGSSRKFAGPPSPSKVLAKYDVRQRSGEATAPCPMCPGVEVSFAPKRVEVMSNKEFEERFVIIKGDLKGRIVLKPKPEGVEHVHLNIDAPSTVPVAEGQALDEAGGVDIP